MGRSFVSIRQGVNGMTGRWARSLRALGTEDRPYAEQLVASARKHSSEAFYGCDDPLEAAIFSALVEISRQQAELPRDGKGPAPDVDP
jgi:hypothetical protein